jgi:magnesium transporter
MIVSSFYGMNVALPGEDNPRMYLILFVISLAVALAVAWWFRQREWLSFNWRRTDKFGEDS